MSERLGFLLLGIICNFCLCSLKKRTQLPLPSPFILPDSSLKKKTIHSDSHFMQCSAVQQEGTNNTLFLFSPPPRKLKPERKYKVSTHIQTPSPPPMASPPDHELTLEFKTHSYTTLLGSLSQQGDEAQKLEEFLSRLEEERAKIDAFKRELPLCMQLLTNAMENSREQLQKWRVRQASRPVLEEFIPLKGSGTGRGREKAASEVEKTCWMTSVQLWSQGEEADGESYQGEPKLTLETSHRTRGAFLPFSKDGHAILTKQIPGLGLCSTAKEKGEREGGIVEDKHGNIKFSQTDSGGVSFPRRETGGMEPGKVGEVQHMGPSTASISNGGQSHRKARRCWSPDLHRRFVNALQMLGGSQVATPKQIRELMKVEGLTNDEVKSHLQKYRLHTRRPSAVAQAGGSGAPQLVVLGGIWVPPEYAVAGHGGAEAIYSMHQSSGHHPPPPYCTPPVPHEFYPVTSMAHAAAAALTHADHRRHHHCHDEEEEEEEQQLRSMYKGCAQEQESVEKNNGGGDCLSGSMEEGRCESREGNRGRERGRSLLEEGGESNVTEITLKV